MDRIASGLEWSDGLSHRGMLESGGDDLVAASTWTGERALDGEVDGLGAIGGEDDVLWVGTAEEAGDLFAGTDERLTRLGATPVKGGWITEVFLPVGCHGVEDCVADGASRERIEGDSFHGAVASRGKQEPRCGREANKLSVPRGSGNAIEAG